MAARARVSVLLLTGFPGSGVTSLLAHRQRAPEFAGAHSPARQNALAMAGDVGE